MAQNLRLNIQSVQPFIKNHELDQMKKPLQTPTKHCTKDRRRQGVYRLG